MALRQQEPIVPGVLDQATAGLHQRPSSSRVLTRMDTRVGELRAGFEGFVRTFVNSERFTGPSWYFHRKTLRIRAEHHTIASLVDDDTFFESLYATLTAWAYTAWGRGTQNCGTSKRFG